MSLGLKEVYWPIIKKITLSVKRRVAMGNMGNMGDMSNIGNMGEIEYEKIALYVHVSHDQKTYVFPGQGDENEAGDRGDVVVRLRLLPSACFEVDTIVSECDLHYTLKVPFFDYLYGNTYDIQHLDGTAIACEYPAQSGKRVHVEGGKGLLKKNECIDRNESERGDLYVFYEVSMPTVSQDRLGNPVTKMVLRKLFCKAAAPAQSA